MKNSNVVIITEGTRQGVAVLWFKNGDHPLDYSVDAQEPDGQSSMAERNNWEGEVVRYYRNPEVKGDTVCNECGKPFHEHGWIDTSAYIVTNTVTSLAKGVVCPGTWIMSYSWDEGKIYHLTDKLGFKYTLFHAEAMNNKTYATNVSMLVTLRKTFVKQLTNEKVQLALNELLTNPFQRHRLSLQIDDEVSYFKLTKLTKSKPDEIKFILVTQEMIAEAWIHE
jgi:hypothetical protein